MRTEYAGRVDEKFIGQIVTLYRWVHRRRDHGGVIFIDMRDEEGLLQVVCDPGQRREPSPLPKDRRTGLRMVKLGRTSAQPRPEGTINEGLVSGQVEVWATGSDDPQRLASGAIPDR